MLINYFKKGQVNIMCLVSQEMRKLAPELDPLRIGTGWKKMRILVKYRLW